MPNIEIMGAERTLLALEEEYKDSEINENWYKTTKAFIESIKNGVTIPDSFEAYSKLLEQIADATDQNFEICNHGKLILLY